MKTQLEDRKKTVPPMLAFNADCVKKQGTFENVGADLNSMEMKVELTCIIQRRYCTHMMFVYYVPKVLADKKEDESRLAVGQQQDKQHVGPTAQWKKMVQVDQNGFMRGAPVQKDIENL